MTSEHHIPVPTTDLLSPQKLNELLNTDAAAVKVLAKGCPPQSGDLVGVRLNLNVLKSTGKAIQTLHQATNRSGYKRNQGFYNGQAIGYSQAVVLKNAYFNVSQSGREAIAQGLQHKFPMASVDGQLVDTIAPDQFQGLPLSFNPKSQHLFVDPQGFAVHHADEVVILGNRVYARGNITYYTQDTAPQRKGDAPSATQFRPAPASLPTSRINTGFAATPVNSYPSSPKPQV